MKIKNSKIIVAALSLSMILSACGNKDNKANDGSNGSNPTESASTANEKKDGDTAKSDQEDFDITVVSREDGSGTRGAFIELVGLEEEKDGEKKDLTTDEAVVQNSTNGVMQTVSQDPSAIGYVSLGSVNDNVQKVKVDGAEATEENIESGDYTLQRPFNLAFKEDKLDDLAKDFLAFVLSKDAQEIVSKEGYIKVEAKDYKAKKVKGNLTIAGSTSVTPLMEKLVEKYKDVNPDANIEIQSTGSSAGIESTISDVSQIAMASRELKDEEKDKLQVEVLAKDGIAVVVNKDDTKINDLTKDQLKEIFSGKVKNTSELSK
ncbi:substrate-binding domain-containing protein [Anaerococcus hydrogenalis]|uniref:Phosphate ABC transporter substrate-binding protein n=1 Tax=Anaerococcus hydrogenalis TaxID=33029 RepID=A0A2N6UK38_9FIRM|nr:substrate-binding domain-containing protein [Anaerococcus hydrogenalis]MBS5988649.1 substrate-binding domain-containing protein [Anaerococcus hydrogenalis]MDK7694165.1 substrate-binding domain-containing protein [Anaerococcus hydrogenalis]MDK7695943.1 substrate-binding domain-containing protein [Anaerococcus hydrogenalis]MDK7707192.1 substrate-binding domain-containing protein [Anaerococcus hydrogenalis]PMC82220.1 phosphate ABC transporter substrate-binding protein [Anaerococcus hydrogenali